MYLLCEALQSLKLDLVESLIYLESQICSCFLLTITYWKPETSHLVQTPWDHKPLNSSIFVTS